MSKNFEILICILLLTQLSKSITISFTSSTTVKVTASDSYGVTLRDSRDRDGDPSVIYFPSSSPDRNSGVKGTQCVTFYSKSGSCQPIQNCFQQPALIQTQLLAHCGVRDNQLLICCPDEAVKAASHPQPARPPTKPNVDSISFPDFEPTINPGPALVENPVSSRPVKPTDALPSGPIWMKPKPENPMVPETAQVHYPVPNPATNPTETATLVPPLPPATNDLPTSKSELDQTCGIFKDGNQSGATWPWIVSIGNQNANGMLRWHCIGSLITTEFVITSALCLLKDTNVATLGSALLGPMTTTESSVLDLRPVSQVMIHSKFVSPELYKNVGLLQIGRISVSERIMPICFPFLASVLDVIHFRGYKATMLGFKFPVYRTAAGATGLEFRTEEFQIMGNEQCSRIFDLMKEPDFNSFPRGIQQDSICALLRHRTDLCQVPGAPLVLYDEASRSNVIIGIASGDPTCSKFKRQLVTFTRMNAYSTWVRQRVATFPAPPPCYY